MAKLDDTAEAKQKPDATQPAAASEHHDPAEKGHEAEHHADEHKDSTHTWSDVLKDTWSGISNTAGKIKDAVTSGAATAVHGLEFTFGLETDTKLAKDAKDFSDKDLWNFGDNGKSKGADAVNAGFLTFDYDFLNSSFNKPADAKAQMPADGKTAAAAAKPEDKTGAVADKSGKEEGFVSKAFDWLGDTWDSMFKKTKNPEKGTEVTTFPDGKGGESKVEIGKNGVDHHSSAGDAHVDGKVATEVDSTGTRATRDKTTGKVTEEGPNGSKLERNPKGGFTLTDDGHTWEYQHGKLYTTDGSGNRVEVNDKEIVTKFRRSLMAVHQHGRKEVPEEEQSETGIHTLEDPQGKGLVRINTAEGTTILAHQDGRKEIIAGKEDEQIKFLIKPGSQDIQAITADGHKIKIHHHNGQWEAHNEDGSASPKVQVNEDGSLQVGNHTLRVNGQGNIDVANQTLKKDGSLQTSDDVRVAATGNKTTVVDANGDGKDATVSAGDKGKSTLVRPGGSTSETDPETGKQKLIRPDGTVEAEYDTNNHTVTVQTKDGPVTFKQNEKGEDEAVAWNGDQIKGDGSLERANGTKFNADNTVSFADGTTVDAYGNVYNGDQYLGTGGNFGDGDGAVGNANQAIAQASALAGEIIAKAQSGQAVDGDVGRLLALFSELGGQKFAVAAAGRLDMVMTLDSAQAAVGAAADQARAQSALREITTRLVGSVPNSVIAELYKNAHGMISEDSVKHSLHKDEPQPGYTRVA